MEISETPWPFVESPTADAYIASSLMDQIESLAFVAHDSDGDWQLLGQSDTQDFEHFPLIDAYQMFPTIAPLIARIPPGWLAQWSPETNEWVVGPHEEEAE